MRIDAMDIGVTGYRENAYPMEVNGMRCIRFSFAVQPFAHLRGLDAPDRGDPLGNN
jgi:hypothetical protein